MLTRQLLRGALTTAAKASPCTASQVCEHETRLLQRQLATLASAEASSPAPAAAASTELEPLPRANGGRAWMFAPFALAAAGCSVAVASAQQTELEPAEGQLEPTKAAQPALLSKSAWLQQLAQQEDVMQVLTADSLQDHPLLKSDHMFSALLRNGMLKDMVCYYDKGHREFHTVLQLGRDVCGFPTIVHGGLTAAVMDETLGFLLFALKQQRQLPFWGPAYTAHLEVNYKAKMPANVGTILCTSKLESCEGRKVWMTCEVKDGPSGKVYATARALFVSPKPQRLVKDVYRYVMDGMFPPNRTGSM